MPLHLKTVQFYRDVQRTLAAEGVVAFNLHPHEQAREDDEDRRLREEPPEALAVRVQQRDPLRLRDRPDESGQRGRRSDEPDEAGAQASGSTLGSFCSFEFGCELGAHAFTSTVGRVQGHEPADQAAAG